MKAERTKTDQIFSGQQGRKQYCLQIPLTVIITRAIRICGILYLYTFKINKCWQHSRVRYQRAHSFSPDWASKLVPHADWP